MNYLIINWKMYRSVLFVLTLILLPFISQTSYATQTPDASTIFNKCISEQKTINLQKGKTYYLKSKVVAGDNIIIRGHGAKIVIPDLSPNQI